MPIAARYDNFTLNIGLEDVDAEIDVDYVSGSVGSGETLELDLTYKTGRPPAEEFDIEWEVSPDTIFAQPPPTPDATYEPNEPDDDDLDEEQSGTLTILFPIASAIIAAMTPEALTAARANGSQQIHYAATATIRQNTSPEFVEGDATGRSITENVSVGTFVGPPVMATDADDDPLTYSLSGSDAGAFRIGTANGQLVTNRLLDYETQDAYSVTVSVSDGRGGSDAITVVISVRDVDARNAPPTFDEGRTTNRSVPENAPPNTKIGAPVSATDADSAELTYSLRGTNADFFNIDSTTGQLLTSGALSYEGQRTFSVVVVVEDDADNTDSILVTINVTNVQE